MFRRRRCTQDGGGGMKASIGTACFLAASRLALLSILSASAAPAFAAGEIDEFVELGRPLEKWAAANGFADYSAGTILALADGEIEVCRDQPSPPSDACAALEKALSVVARVKKYGDTVWRCAEYPKSGKQVDDGHSPIWLIGGRDDIMLFNLSRAESGYIEGGWGKVAINFYRRGSPAPFETFEFTRTEEQTWGDLVHHADFGAEISAQFNHALSIGSTSVTTSFDTSGNFIKTVETSLVGYTRTMKLCGFQ